MEPANLSRAALGAFRALTARPIAARVPLDAALDVDGVDGALDGPMPNGTPAKGKKKTMKPTKGSKGASEDGRAAGSARFLAKVAAAPLGDAGSSADAQFLLLLTVQSDGIHGHVPGRGPVVSRSVPPGTSFACPAVFLADSTNEEEPSGTIAVAVNVAPDVPPAEVGRQIWAWPVPGPATRQEPVKRTLDLPIFALEPLPGRLLLALHSDGSATFVETSKGLIVKRQAASPFSGQRVLWAEVINGSQATEDVFTALSLITSDINGRLNFARVDVRRDFVLAPTVGAELSASLEAGTTFAYAEDDSSSQLAVAGRVSRNCSCSRIFY